MDIIIGREEGTDKARLSLTCNAKTLMAGPPGSVPATVSRKHLRIVLSENDDTVTVENLSENNLVFVDGLDVRRLIRVSRAAIVELGKDRYPIDMNAVIKLFSAQQQYSISHLQKVEERYRKARMDHQIKQARFNALSTITPILTMGSMAAGFVIKGEGMAALRTAMYVLAALLAFLFFVFRWINSKKAPEQLQQLDEAYQKQYICPNPACRSFFGAGLRYDNLRKLGKCPHCGARLIEK